MWKNSDDYNDNEKKFKISKDNRNDTIGILKIFLRNVE